MKLPRRKWQLQVVTVDREGIVLQRERYWKYWTRRSALTGMKYAQRDIRWGYEGYRPILMVARIHD